MSEYLLISDAAKEVQVESHVLRYWEEELHLPIKRNELGHRFYTREDVERFLQIKSMKERGLQLKAIKMILKEGRLDLISGLDGRWLTENTGDREEDAAGDRKEAVSREKKENTVGITADEKNSNYAGSAEESRQQSPHIGAQRGVSGLEAGTGSAPRMGIEIVESRDLQEVSKTNPEDRSRRLQWLLRQMMQEAVRENNEELCRSIKESVIKELDYQFRMQEERQDEREKESLQRSEEYYRRMDELLRQRSRGRRLKGQEMFSKGGSPEAKDDGEKPQKGNKGELETAGNEKKTIFRFWAPGRKTV